MKSLRQFSFFLAVCFCLWEPKETKAYDASSWVTVERYTILANGSLEYATGSLLKSGQFKVIMSYIVDPLFYDSIDDFAAISGRPIIMVGFFDAYKASGILPNWVRSRDTFPIGFADYVIVAIKGKGDPNPVPTILEDPESDWVLAGDTAYFFVDAIPWSASYQWYFKNKPIPGETDSLLIISKVTKANAGLYSVGVSTGGNPLMSKKALLTVVQPVVIKTEPKSQTLKTGKNLTLRVAATGTPPFTYEWWFNGHQITNATKSFLTISKATAANAGSYWVFVDNGPSWTASSTAVVTVAP